MNTKIEQAFLASLQRGQGTGSISPPGPYARSKWRRVFRSERVMNVFTAFYSTFIRSSVYDTPQHEYQWPTELYSENGFIF